MTEMTVMEGLAELKTIPKRIERKREFMQDYVVRQEMMKDPLAEDGGSAKVIDQERQAIVDLTERMISIRRAIARTNAEFTIAIGGQERSIQDWLVWRREVSPVLSRIQGNLRQAVGSARDQATKKGFNVRKADDESVNGKPTDVIVNINEMSLGKEIENMEVILGALDGQLSLRNATLTIKVED